MKNLPLSSHHLHHRPIPRTSTLHFPSNPSQSLPSKLSPKSPSQVKDMRRATVVNVGIPTVIMKREMLEKKLRKQRKCSIEGRNGGGKLGFWGNTVMDIIDKKEDNDRC